MESQSDAQKIYRGMMEKDHFSQWMGIECVNITQGSCELRMKVKKEMLNGFDILHGGILFSLADSALAFAANTQGRVSLSVEASISFIASAKENDIITAKATEINLTDKFGIYDIFIFNTKCEKIAIFRGTVYRTSKNHIL